MQDENRQTVIILVVIFVALVISLIAVGITVYNIAQNSKDVFEVKSTKVPTFVKEPNIGTTTPTPEGNANSDVGDYVFSVDNDGAYKMIDYELAYNFQTIDYDLYFNNPNVKTGIKDENLVDIKVKKRIEDLPYDKVDIKQIMIPKIAVYADVMQGNDPDTALANGWWFYPLSNLNGGEKIFFCYRHYFGRYNGNSCWNLNLLSKDDVIFLINIKDERTTYKVISIGIIPNSDNAKNENLLIPANDDYVKIISSSSSDGRPGGSDFKIVVLAKKS